MSDIDLQALLSKGVENMTIAEMQTATDEINRICDALEGVGP